MRQHTSRRQDEPEARTPSAFVDALATRSLGSKPYDAWLWPRSPPSLIRRCLSSSSRVAVVRGNVVLQDGSPLVGVNISFLQHPEYGYTISRQDGRSVHANTHTHAHTYTHKHGRVHAHVHIQTHTHAHTHTHTH